MLEGFSEKIVWQIHYEVSPVYTSIELPVDLPTFNIVGDSYRGTLIEAGAAYMKKKPIVAIIGSGGTADKYAGKYLDERKRVKILSAKTPIEALDMILKS